MHKTTSHACVQMTPSLCVLSGSVMPVEWVAAFTLQLCIGVAHLQVHGSIMTCVQRTSHPFTPTHPLVNPPFPFVAQRGGASRHQERQRALISSRS